MMLRKLLVPHWNLYLVFVTRCKITLRSQKKEALKLTSLVGKENGVVMPDSWIANVYAGNMWLRGLRKRH